MLPIGNPSLIAPEIKWYHDKVNTNYHIILDIRNECAVAALALHEWQLYSYNNRIYTQLFKEMSADDTLGEYVSTMQQSQTNKTIAIILLVLLMISIVPAYYLLYYRHRLYERFAREQQRRTDLELLDDELRKAELEDSNLHVSNAVLDNCLSALKHETMYYPSRIRQLIEQDDMASAREVVDYYRELYNLLSLQAMSQVECVKLHLKPLEHGLLGDEVLIRYLYDILRQMSGQKQLDFNYSLHGDLYVEVQCSFKHQSPISQIQQLLCRQIVRDHGEATNRRGCAIRAEHTRGMVTIVITLPRAGQKVLS